MTGLERSKCAILPLVLKGKWYDMIASGVKREEYRLATRYWRIRLKNWDEASSRDGKTPIVEFRRGYAKNAPRMAYWCFGLPTASGLKAYAYVDATVESGGRPEWGEPEEPHFVIRLGGRVELQICRSQIGHQHWLGGGAMRQSPKGGVEK